MITLNKRKEWNEVIQDTVITQQQWESINKIIDKYKTMMMYLVRRLAYIVKYRVYEEHNMSIYDYYEYLHNKSDINLHTLENYKLRFGSVEGEKRYLENKKKKQQTQENFIKRYGEKVGNELWDLFRKRCSGNKTIERFIEKYGEIEGPKKHQEVMNKCKPGEFSTLKYYIERHGEEEGTKIYNNKIEKLHHGSTLQGFIEKYGEVEGPKKLKIAKNNTSRESFIKRYGEEEGNKRYNDYAARGRYRNTIEYYIEKYGEVEGSKKYIKWRTSCAFTTGYSPVSQQLFAEIYNRVPTHQQFLKYATLNGELSLFDNPRKMYSYDFVDLKTKKIIEFNGDCYHGNPTIFAADDHPHPFAKHLTAKEMWEKDNIKTKCAERYGYTVMVVWEKDYKENKQLIIDNCISFITDECKI